MSSLGNISFYEHTAKVWIQRSTATSVLQSRKSSISGSTSFTTLCLGADAPLGNYGAEPVRPFMIQPAMPRSQEGSFYQESLPPTLHGGIQREELEDFLQEWMQKQALPVITPIGQHRPYPLEVEREPFPEGFRMPVFERFNGTTDPQEHLMQFTWAMGNLANNPNYCLRLFGSTLTGNAFQWYLTLPNGSVKTWDRMQQLFVGRFFVTERDVTIADLFSVTQKPNESVQDYIKRWRREATRCRQQLPEMEQISLCRRGMRPKIALPLCEEITTFKRLATDAHTKERLLAETKRKEATSKPQRKDKSAPSANTTEVKPQTGDSSQSGGKPGLGKRNRRKYTFLEQDVVPIFE